MNKYAKYCLGQEQIAEDGPGSWNFESCIFLQGDLCAIYEARPLGCRSFISPRLKALLYLKTCRQPNPYPDFSLISMK
jgi:Fe-S-cluster containining protein